jgi:hypothetical protein
VLPIYIKHTLETPKVVLLGLLLAERVIAHTHTWQDHYEPHENEEHHSHAMEHSHYNYLCEIKEEDEV